MIIGLGIDITELDRIERSLEKFGERFMEKILTEKEMKLIPEKNPVPFLAARFAAKEAAVKALGTGFAEGVTFQCIEILRLESGAPQLNFLGKALERSRLIEVDSIHISITHGRDNAAAVVVLEKI
ncbi:holo-[acyl-carrier-protein] synthase [Maridesulfovibrio hydrothermalis]|uniref:Holo-[acyl-carrier-protein] synthase n=1 Tax=Maridesulfovibrio hydrothermalis AM13 = DSM 14728 TaxID=1121451 RepID=L0REB9_9BACT|nr:holo-[acyl-carrier-protein] synthase [Maridesulfovibrio hydrothermalis]CCO24530.1 Holo-[acyl-carrier-protein] synthase [Maridesulfovibrio hydrothermalis AM13 = DSM 14728]